MSILSFTLLCILLSNSNAAYTLSHITPKEKIVGLSEDQSSPLDLAELEPTNKHVLWLKYTPWSRKDASIGENMFHLGKTHPLWNYDSSWLQVQSVTSQKNATIELVLTAQENKCTKN